MFQCRDMYFYIFLSKARPSHQSEKTKYFCLTGKFCSIPILTYSLKFYNDWLGGGEGISLSLAFATTSFILQKLLIVDLNTTGLKCTINWLITQPIKSMREWNLAHDWYQNTRTEWGETRVVFLWSVLHSVSDIHIKQSTCKYWEQWRAGGHGCQTCLTKYLITDCTLKMITGQTVSPSKIYTSHAFIKAK